MLSVNALRKAMRDTFFGIKFWGDKNLLFTLGGFFVRERLAGPSHMEDRSTYTLPLQYTTELMYKNNKIAKLKIQEQNVLGN